MCEHAWDTFNPNLLLSIYVYDDNQKSPLISLKYTYPFICDRPGQIGLDGLSNNHIFISLDQMIIKIHQEETWQSLCFLKSADLFFPIIYHITWLKTIGWRT